MTKRAWRFTPNNCWNEVFVQCLADSVVRFKEMGFVQLIIAGRCWFSCAVDNCMYRWICMFLHDCHRRDNSISAETSACCFYCSFQKLRSICPIGRVEFRFFSLGNCRRILRSVGKNRQFLARTVDNKRCWTAASADVQNNKKSKFILRSCVVLDF